MVASVAQAAEQGILGKLAPGLVASSVGIASLKSHRHLMEFLYDQVTPWTRIVGLVVSFCFLAIGAYAFIRNGPP